MLVLDIIVPILDGIEAIRSLRAAGSRSKFVFLTVHGDEDYVRRARGRRSRIRRQVPARIRLTSRLREDSPVVGSFADPLPGMSDLCRLACGPDVPPADIDGSALAILRPGRVPEDCRQPGIFLYTDCQS